MPGHDETFLQCVVREVHEEISYFVAPERFDHLASYSGTDADAQGGTLRGEFFVARDVPADALHITEGSLVLVERDAYWFAGGSWHRLLNSQ